MLLMDAPFSAIKVHRESSEVLAERKGTEVGLHTDTADVCELHIGARRGERCVGRLVFSSLDIQGEGVLDSGGVHIVVAKFLLL